MLRVGFIVDDSDQTHLVADLIRRANASTLYTIEILIVQKRPSKLKRITGSFRSSKEFFKLLRRTSFSILATAEARLVYLLRKRLSAVSGISDTQFRSIFSKHPLGSFGTATMRVKPLISRSGYVYTYTNDDIARIKSLNLDLLIRGGSGILRGNILNLTRFGVISFHHADNAVNRGGPPGFWEAFNREDSTGFVIQRLLPELDGGDVIFRGSIATSPIYSVNHINLIAKTNFFMHRVLEDIARKLELPEIERKCPYAFPLYTTPTVFQQFPTWLKLVRTVGADFRQCGA